MERVLITGGSGFLGTALVDRLQNYNLVVVGRNEGNLVKLKEKYPKVEIIVGDLCNLSVCAKLRDIDTVFHLAAMKHIGLAEENTESCIMNNIIGTMNLLSFCRPKTFVFVSTDKAAQVNGVYGATKFLCERLIREYEKYYPETDYRVVRYGNVLYSTGSVLCKWRDKMKNGEEITVTDPESTRFYWTVDEAIDLIFDCLENATDSTPYTPKMKAIVMKDLLDCMLKKYGEVPVKVIGLQSGENKHETVDGKHFSNKVEKYTKEEIMEMI
jgi:UDP-N-acetylglucosamine 4,6-dehydratase